MKLKFMAAATGMAVLLSCGTTGPESSGLAPSTLTVTFTGSTDGDTTSPHPLPVTGSGGTDGTSSVCRVTASWTMCTDHGFSSYMLYRSQSPGIASDTSTAVLVQEIDNYNTTICADETVTWDTEYYYALMTSDSEGNGVWSNEASVATPEMDAPTPSLLYLAQQTWFNAEIGWTPCPETNFLTYRLYRSTCPGIQSDTAGAELLATTDWRFDTSFVDGTTEPSTVYYYSLLTTNTEGLSSWSNEIDILTYEQVPKNVVATLTVGSSPWDAAALPSGEYVYVTSRGDNTVSVIGTADLSVVETITVGDTPYGICSGAGGQYVYTANWGSGDVSVIRTSDNTVVQTVDVGDRPVGICVLPSGGYLYVTCRDGNAVTVMSTSDHTVVDTVAVGTSPYQICSLPSGDYVYVSNFSSNDMSVIRTSDNTVTHTVDLFARPTGICAHPEGDYVYVSNYISEVVAVVRTSDNTLQETVNTGMGPWGLCAHPAGDCLYVLNSIDGTMEMVRTSDNQVLDQVDTGQTPSNMCVVPDGTSAFVVNYGEGTVTVLQ